MTETLKLIIPFDDFKSKIEGQIIAANNIRNILIESDEQLQELKAKIDAWNTECLSILSRSFNNEDNAVKNEFYNFNTTSRTSISLTGLSEFHKEIVKQKQSFLNYNLRIYSVSEAIIDSDKIDMKIRNSYTIEQKLNLLLDKLNILYDDSFYPIKDILIGNGILIKRFNEELAFAKSLANRGLIEIYPDMSQDISARLTIEGVMYIEENKKPIKENYEEIDKTAEEIIIQINEIIEKLKLLGYGQEIIFSELEELKDLYLSLNKKNWGQVVKGKLIDLTLAKLIENDTIGYIYEKLTNHKLSLP